MILLTILIHATAANACYSGASRAACLEGNRAKARAFNERADQNEARLVTARQALAALRQEENECAGKLARLGAERGLGQREQAFLANSAENEAPLFPGGPRLRDLPSFQKAAVDWDEAQPAKRSARLSTIIEQKMAEEKSLAAQKEDAGRRAGGLTAEIDRLREDTINARNAALAHQSNESYCNDICPKGPNQTQLY